MQTTIFSENKNSIGKAEDARPLVENNFIVVADGLGSCIKHTGALIGIHNLDKFFYEAFSGILSTEDGNKEKVFENFIDLNFSNERHSSAYLASNLVVLTIYDLFNNEKAKDIVDFLINPKFNSNEELQIIENNFGNLIAKKILNNLNLLKTNLQLKDERPQMIADRNNFLPTTLVCCAFDEKSNDIDTLIFWAGDSRAYLLDKDGLAPLTDDEEEYSGGGLSNFIQLLRPFHIRCNYKKHNKPCVLIAMTDGVFDKKTYGRAETKEKVLIPIEFELEFLKLLIDADNLTSFRHNAESFYAKNIVGDDSASIALKAFGFKDYQDLRKMCMQRFESLTHIKESLREGFDDNDHEELKKHTSVLLDELLDKIKPDLKSEIIKKLTVIANAIINNTYLSISSPFMPDIIKDTLNLENEIKRKFFFEVNNCEGALIKNQQLLRNLLSKNWLYFRSIFTTDSLPKSFLKDYDKDYDKAISRKKERMNDHYQETEEKIRIFHSLVEKIDLQMLLIRNYQINPEDYTPFKECRYAIVEILDYIEDSVTGKNPNIKDIRRQDCVMENIAIKIWNKEQKDFDEVQALFNGDSSSIDKLEETDKIIMAKKVAKDISDLTKRLSIANENLGNYVELIAVKLFIRFFKPLIKNALKTGDDILGIQIPEDFNNDYQMIIKEYMNFEQEYKKQLAAYNAFTHNYCKYYKGDLNA